VYQIIFAPQDLPWYMPDVSAVVEIRVPTYRRPAWLRHALSTVLAQSFSEWHVLVFDDSPDREGEAVVRELGDRRISYRPNARNLGATGNLNQAFQTEPYVGGRYACVVEDDNWLLPDYLRENVRVIAESGCAILHRNQQIWSRFSDPPVATPKTTLGDWYPQGRLRPAQLRAYALLFPGISNGALFWATDARSQLRVSDEMRDASLQEMCRCLQIVEDSFFAHECLAVWADVPLNKTRQPFYTSRQFGRFQQFVRGQLVRLHGTALLEDAAAIAERRGQRELFERNVFNALVFSPERRVLSLPGFVAAVARATAKYALVRNPAPWYQVPGAPANDASVRIGRQN
jgi:hypothetical protein